VYRCAILCPQCDAPPGVSCGCQAREKAIERVKDLDMDAFDAGRGFADLEAYEQVFEGVANGLPFERDRTWRYRDADGKTIEREDYEAGGVAYVYDDDADSDPPRFVSTTIDVLGFLDSVTPDPKTMTLALSLSLDARRRGPAANDAPEAPAAPTSVQIDGDLSRMVREAARVIAGARGIYWRRSATGADLVRVLRDEPAPDGLRRDRRAPTIAALSPDAVRMVLADSATWERLAKRKVLRASPPRDVVAGLMSRDSFGCPYLEGVTSSPILRPDLSVCECPGYDPATRLLYEPHDRFPSVRAMSPAEGASALLDVVADFPFLDASHRAAWIASVLTPIARAAFNGSAPMFVFDAATPGTGKTLLLDIASIIATGAKCAKQSQVGDEEMEKRILALALSGDALVAIDNLHETLGGSALEAAVTSSVCQGRTLGKTEMRAVPLRMCWYATGNNVEVSRDLQRRVLPIRLVASQERPEARGGFRYPDLEQHVRENRARLFCAALAVLRGPRASVSPFGSFDDWSRVVRGAMVGAGLPDPIGARDEITDRGDEMREAQVAFFEAIEQAQKGGSASARELLASPQVLTAARELATGRPGDEVTSHALGVMLRSLRDRVLNGRRLTCESRQNTMRWRVVSV
jgi:hypothetical protein